MALAVDASSPARVSGSTTNGTVAVTTGTFNPPACVLVATVQANARPGGATGVVTNNATGLTWTKVGERSMATAGNTNRGYAGIFVAVLSAGRTGMTVTATLTASSGVATEINVPTIKVYVVTGANSSPNGASITGQSIANSLITDALTAAGASSLGFVSASEWNALGTPTSSDSTVDGGTSAGGFISVASGYKTLGAAGSSATLNVDAPGTSAAEWNWVAAEILAPTGTVYTKTGGGAVPASGSGARVLNYQKAGGGAAPAAGSGARTLDHQKVGGAVSVASGSGAKAVTGAAVIAKTGGGVAPAAGSGAKTVTSATVYAKAGGAVSSATGSGARTVEYDKTGGATATAAGSGAKTVTSAATIAKTGGGVSAADGSGAKTVTSAAVIIKTGGAVATGAGSGVKTVTGSSDIAKTGGATATAAGSGAKAVTGAAVYVKTGGGAASAAGAGARATTSATVIVKAGGGTATGAGIALKVVIHPTIYIKAGGAVAWCVGGSVPAVPEIPGPVADWPPVFTGPEAAPLVLFSGPEAAPLVLVSPATPAPLVLISGHVPAPSPGSTSHPMMARRGAFRRSMPALADEFVIEAFRQLRARRRADKIRKANS